MSDNTGGQAFPFVEYNGNGDVYNSGVGMDLRDYFAAKALNGLLSNPGTCQINDEKVFARDAYLLADAMLEVRGK